MAMVSARFSGPGNAFALKPQTFGISKIMSAFYREKVLSVHHWTDTLFS
ncbi:ferredoxin--NADP(+) reductase, partial [Pseudomonas sp. GW531-E2]